MAHWTIADGRIWYDEVDDNPYAGADWTISPVTGVTHAHCENREQFGMLYDSGVRHMAISNYYPSKPCWIRKRWLEIPDDAIECPNAEHHNVSNVNVSSENGHAHYNGIGSTFASGASEKRAYPFGVEKMRWEHAFDNILGALILPDGGGLTINHPQYSSHTVYNTEMMLRYDPRVLGIEIWNYSADVNLGAEYNLELWDAVLADGYRCYGFAVPDHGAQYQHGRWTGVTHILAAPDNASCLRAYRRGLFYAGWKTQGGLAFAGVDYLADNGGAIAASAPGADAMRVTTNLGETVIEGDSLQIEIDPEWTYARVDAWTGTEAQKTDWIWANPCMYRNMVRVRRRNLQRQQMIMM